AAAGRRVGPAGGSAERPGDERAHPDLLISTLCGVSLGHSGGRRPKIAPGLVICVEPADRIVGEFPWHFYPGSGAPTRWGRRGPASALVGRARIFIWPAL